MYADVRREWALYGSVYDTQLCSVAPCIPAEEKLVDRRAGLATSAHRTVEGQKAISMQEVKLLHRPANAASLYMHADGARVWALFVRKITHDHVDFLHVFQLRNRFVIEGQGSKGS